MKKKIVAIALVALLTISSVFATNVSLQLVNENNSSRFGSNKSSVKMTNEKFGVGLSLGYLGLGPSLSYTKNDLDKLFGFRWYMDLGFNWWRTSFRLNTSFDWVFLKLIFTDTGSKQAENSVLDFGLGAGLILDVDGTGRTGLAAVGSFTITYNFAENWQVFSRTSSGWGWWFAGGQDASAGFLWDERVGFTYQFDLAKNKR